MLDSPDSASIEPGPVPIETVPSPVPTDAVTDPVPASAVPFPNPVPPNGVLAHDPAPANAVPETGPSPVIVAHLPDPDSVSVSPLGYPDVADRDSVISTQPRGVGAGQTSAVVTRFGRQVRPPNRFSYGVSAQRVEDTPPTGSVLNLLRSIFVA
ncbi:hypothetical protein PAMA_012927 [Pampus argenteus]